MHGGVGCGKTMIMDMFFDSIHSRAKLRTHFHDFMLDVHERLHKFKLTLPPSHISDVSVNSVPRPGPFLILNHNQLSDL